MKHCNRCNRDLPDNKFGKNGNGSRSICKDCLGMIRCRKITFDCYYSTYEQPIQLWIFDAAKKTGCEIVSVKVHGSLIRKYKVIIRCSKQRYFLFVEYFVSKAGKMIDYLSY